MNDLTLEERSARVLDNYIPCGETWRVSQHWPEDYYERRKQMLHDLWEAFMRTQSRLWMLESLIKEANG